MKLPAKSSRRSEEIRRRRMSQSHTTSQATKRRKNRVVSPPLPPVMARTPTTGVTRPGSKKGRGGRTFHNVHLDAAHGAEMSLPALPKLVLSWRILSLLIVAVLGYALYLLWQSPNYRIDAPALAGLQRLNSNQVISELGLTGEPIFLLNAQDIRANLLVAFPEFSDAAVRIELPNTVMITVTERIPVLAWVRDGASFLVDEQGVTFPMRSSAMNASYPVVQASGDPPAIAQPGVEEASMRQVTISKITGVLLPQLPPQEQVKALLTPEMVKAVLLISKQAPAGAKLIYDPAHGLGWTDRRGWNVYLGNETDMEIKLQMYRAIFEKIKADEETPQMISVEYTHAPYFRLQQ